MSDYRLTIKVRNARLLRAIERAGHRPGCKLADLIGIEYSNDLLGYLNLSRSPVNRDGTLRDSALKLCAFLNALPDECWSEQQLTPLASNCAEIDLSGEQIQDLWLGGGLSADPFELFQRKETAAQIRAVLQTLTPREEQVIRSCFGINVPEKSLEQIAKVMGISITRAGQIARKALRKLRNPERNLTSIADACGIQIKEGRHAGFQ